MKTQDFICYESTLQLSKDGKELIILNKKYTDNKVLTTVEQQGRDKTEMLVRNKRKNNRNKSISKAKLLQKVIQISHNRNKSALSKFSGSKPNEQQLNQSADDILIDSDDLLSTDEEIEEKKKNYKWVKTRSSYKVNDITGIVFGGMTSRFWVLRKYINMKFAT